jgi:hypothetical protein
MKELTIGIYQVCDVKILEMITHCFFEWAKIAWIAWILDKLAFSPFDQIRMRTSDLQKCLFHKKTPKKILQIYLCMYQCWVIINLQSPIFVELMSQRLGTWIYVSLTIPNSI